MLLDGDNPRLPIALTDRSQEAMLEHLYRTAALQELAESIYSNGFFSSEPVIVGPANADGKRIVLEGNRRLATVLVLSQEPRALDAGISFRIDGELVSKEVDGLPVVEVDDPDEFEAYLGFRHISGLRMWGAGEKARYLWGRVNAYTGNDDAFYRVGRQVGSNARGVRSAYVAFETLQHASREGIDPETVSFVISERFGVWTRLLGTRNVAPYINLDTTKTELPDVQGAIAAIQINRLRDVLNDLRPTAGRIEPVLRDSRQVTDYSDVLGDEAARDVLHTSGNLDLAAMIAQRPDVDEQLQGIIDQLNVLIDAITEDAKITEQTINLSSRVSKSAKLLSLTISAYGDEV
ncbi:ParB N-terminal domain-containing protein [Microbacterium sp. NPDC087665]|uniref:ParB N-terminal domain-containing protein n=1 Tax=Microbacterium sp. NPDC087665 TaxID=3364194 RepID=UPI003806E6FA